MNDPTLALSMEVLFADALTPAKAKNIAALLYRVWPDSSRVTGRRGLSFEERLARVSTEWVGYDGPPEVRPRYFMVWDTSPDATPGEQDDRVAIASALAAPRTIRTSAGEMTILALARVCTAPERRGEGLGAQVVRAVFQLVDQRDYPFALFQTTPEVRPFYEKLGASVVENDFVNSLAEDPSARPFWSEVVLRYPDGPGWPDGTIDLMGPGY